MPHYSTFRAELNYQDEITADEITVIFNGTTYTVPKDPDGLYGLGTLMDRGIATGDYPFCIARESGTNYVYVNADVYANHNPFTIKIVTEGVTTTPCFDKARGYSCEEERATLTEESVTTTAQGGVNEGMLSYSQFIDADTLIVTFDGVEYECPRIAVNSRNMYGGINQYDLDFSEYPFAINSSTHGNDFVTETAGTYSVKIQTFEEAITTTPCFKKAVQSATSPLIVEATLSPGEATTQSPSYLQASIEEIMKAMTTRGVVVEDPYGILYSVLSVTDATVTIAIGVYNSTTQQTNFSAFCYTNSPDGLRYPPESVA